MTPHPPSVIHDPDDDETWERIARHLTGESPAGEAAEVVAWASADPASARLLESTSFTLALAQAELSGVSGAPDERVRADQAWRELDLRLDAPLDDAPALSGPVVGTPRGPRSSSISPTSGSRPIVMSRSDRRQRRRERAPGLLLRAAGVLLVLGGAAVLLRGRGDVVEAPVAAAPRPVPVPREFATRRGQRSTVRLADGTRVTLGPGSILRLRAGFVLDSGVTAGPRDVSLEGEAFFEVTHDEARPFAVHGAAGVARDLGTSFAVRSYSAERSMRVAVVSGVVSFRGPTRAASDTGRVADSTSAPTAAIAAPDSLLLRAGDVAEAVPGYAPLRLPAGAAAPLLAWTRDTLVFADAPLSRVAVELERWYSVRVLIPDTALARERLTAVIPRGDLAEVLEVITLALGVQPERQGSRVVLRRR